jgi:hypothetical protein
LLIPITGEHPKGYLFFAGSGKFATVLENPNRPKNAGRADGVFAAFGTWSVDEASKTTTIHIEGSTSQALEGTDRKSTRILNGDDMRVTGP